MKAALRSRTLWLNWVLVAIAAACEAAPQMQVLFAEHASRVLAVVAFVNILLRHATSQSVAMPSLRRNPGSDQP